MQWHTLVFLDIDGTLLKPDYTVNSQRVPKLIQKLAQGGYLFCLNSNRSINDLKPFVRQFAVNGPVIAENGIAWLWKKKTKRLIPAKPIRTLLNKSLATLAKQECAQVFFRDTVQPAPKRLKQIQLAWVANRFRKWTASIHVWSRGKRNVPAARMLARLLGRKFGKSYAIRVSRIFANVLIVPRTSGKEKGALFLRNRYFPNARIVMVGDDEADLEMANIADAFYAVGNATRGMKRRADFVAGSSYARGVAEILRAIDNGTLTI